MASEDHLNLSEQIKFVHKKLRDRTRKCGAETAWCEHLKSKAKLQTYAAAMKDLATKHWKENGKKSPAKKENRCRIYWSVNYSSEYFFTDRTVSFLRERELRIEKDMKADAPEDIKDYNLLTDSCRREFFETNRIKLLDVGSCYNPFQQYPQFDVTAIDIAPAVTDVFECDFLNVEVGGERLGSDESPNEITQLPESFFDIVVFSLLLEYFPTSEQRISCCEKAYRLLKPEGLLLIVTPDSKHVGANAKLMKTWRYAMSLMGFNRVKYEKLEHITCMAFRRCLNAEVAKRWARIHKEEYMDYRIEIPQDKNVCESLDNDDTEDNMMYKGNKNVLKNDKELDLVLETKSY